MQTAYRAEFFDNHIDLVDWAQIANATVRFDYLTLEETSFSTGKVLNSVAPGHLCRLVSGAQTVYSGIVLSKETSKDGTNVTIKPLISMFDVTCMFNRSELGSKSLETFITNIMESLYAGSDTLQNFCGFSTIVNTSTQNAKLNLKDNIHSLYDILTTALKKYGVIVSAGFDPASKTVTATVGAVENKNWTIEADLSECMNVSVDYSDGLDGINKLVMVNKSNESNEVTYYLHPDGSVDTNDTNRVLPVKFQYQYIEDDNFDEAAAEQATSTLTPKKYDNLIQLTVSNDNKIVRWKNHEIGEPALIVYSEKTYESVFTGYEDDGVTSKLTFGVVRLELTKKLILERRANR